eukprot:5062282-Alexandrium_andersonii.AAC.1
MCIRDSTCAARCFSPRRCSPALSRGLALIGALGEEGGARQGSFRPLRNHAGGRAGTTEARPRGRGPD